MNNPLRAKSSPRFYNRTNELYALSKAWDHKDTIGKFILMYGRRRLGKTYLLQQFFGNKSGRKLRNHCYYLADQTTAQEQREALAQGILEALPNPGVTQAEIAVSWNALLRHVSTHCQKGDRFGLVLDEFPYLVEQSPELPSVLQAWWDREGEHCRAMVILCGSHLSIMAALADKNAPLHGRFNAGTMKLDPLGYEDAALFYQGRQQYGVREKLLMYGALGGTPRYHALVDTNLPYDEALVDLLLRPRSPLENEVQFLLNSEQIRDPANYNAVLKMIARGETRPSRIEQMTGISHSALNHVLKNLMDLNWVKRELSFGDEHGKRSLYVIADPLLHFWYRFVWTNRSSLQFGDPKQVFDERIAPFLNDFMGQYIFEDVCKQWLCKHSQGEFGITPKSVERYWSRDNQVEIDIVCDLGSDKYLFGECKWRDNRPMGLEDFQTISGKVARMPNRNMANGATWALFTTSGFTNDLIANAQNPDNRLHLIGPDKLLPSA